MGGGKLAHVGVDPSGGMLTYVVGWLIHVNGVVTHVVGGGPSEWWWC